MRSRYGPYESIMCALGWINDTVGGRGRDARRKTCTSFATRYDEDKLKVRASVIPNNSESARLKDRRRPFRQARLIWRLKRGEHFHLASEKKNGEAREGGGGSKRERDSRGVKGVYEKERDIERHIRGGWGERTGRGSVAPRSHAFRSVMAAAGRSDAPRPSPSCAHAHTAAGPGRPASLPSERGEKERLRKTERKQRALSSVRTRYVYWIFGDTSPGIPLGIPEPRDHSRDAPRPRCCRCSCEIFDTESTHIGRFSFSYYFGLNLISIFCMLADSLSNSLKKLVGLFFFMIAK